MTRKKNKLKLLFLFIFFGIIVALIVLTSLATTNTQTKQGTSTFASATNFDQYCENGVYYIQKDGNRISCGRAPNCDGRSYESVEGMSWRNNAECWVEDYYGGSRCKAYCAGNIPLCCYKLAQTKNAEDCTWPERGYCLPSQCQGVGENCGGPIGTWCTSIDKCVNNKNDIPYIPLESRLSGQAVTQIPPTSPPQPTNTPKPSTTPRPPTPQTTKTPQPPTSTTRPNQPTSTPAPTRKFQPTYEPIPTNQQQPTSQQSNNGVNIEPSYQPPQENPTNTPFQMPRIEIKTPKELAREVINPENIQKLNNKTEVPFEAPKKGFNLIQNIDKSIERSAESWIFKIRIFIEKFIH